MLRMEFLNKTDVPFERSFSLEEALNRALLTASQYRLCPHFQLSGNSDLMTVRCCLSDARNEFVDHGYGKGSETEAKVGAIYEALEHWFNREEQWGDELELISPIYISNNLNSVLSEILISALKSLNKENNIYVRKYTKLGSPLESYKLPAALSCPSLAEATLQNTAFGRYCTNSGVAIGNTDFEAIVHGAMEAIEREAISNLLIALFIYKSKESAVLVRNSSLPDGIKDLLTIAQNRIGSKISILRLNSNCGVPVYCAASHVKEAICQPAGFGASLRHEHALRRAIVELVQGRDIVDIFHPNEWRIKAEAKLRQLESSAIHKTCYRLRILEACDHIGIGYEDFEEGESDYNVNINEYINDLTDRLTKYGRSIFTSFIKKTETHSVVHALLARQSYFFAAIEGAYVFPEL